MAQHNKLISEFKREAVRLIEKPSSNIARGRGDAGDELEIKSLHTA